MAEPIRNESWYSDPTADRRAHKRSRTFLGGNIAVSSGKNIPCIVRDISFGGAKLSLHPYVPVPTLIELHVTCLDRTFQANIRWRSLDLMGIQFRFLIDRNSPRTFAYVVGDDPAARWAASLIFKRYGYLVHEAESVEEAASSILAMGPWHPMHRQGQPILFAVSDEPNIRASLTLVHLTCPMALIILASDNYVDPGHLVNAVLPRCFTAREIRELLERIVPEVVTRRVAGLRVLEHIPSHDREAPA
jgi:hypothetical protein